MGGKRPTRAPRPPAFPVGSGEIDFRAAAFTAGEATFVVMSLPSTAAEAPDLTAAERDVRALILRGLANAEIARARGTSVRTVANQVAALMRKLGVGSRAELAALALTIAGGTLSDE